MYSHPPPPYYHNYPSKYRKRSCASSCCRCIQCLCCFIFIFVLLILASIFIFYSIYDPKIPIYSIQNFKVKAFNVQPGLTLRTDLELSVLAENPNKHLGIRYGDKNSVEVKFNNVTISTGKFPGFHQGTKNMTIIMFGIKGNTTLDSDLQLAYNESQSRHVMPLVINMGVPVSYLIGERALKEVKAIVNCSMVVENLTPNSTDVKILNMHVDVHFKIF